MTEILSLTDIGECISCGTKQGLNHDHFYPQCLIGPRSTRKYIQGNPLRVIVEHQSNVFAFCEAEHAHLDTLKVAAFLGNDYNLKPPSKDRLAEGNPEALIQFLSDHYPITRNRRYFEDQIHCMHLINGLFVAAARSLNGELPDEVKERYQRAAILAEEYNKRLLEVSPPPLYFGGEFLNIPRVVE